MNMSNSKGNNSCRNNGNRQQPAAAAALVCVLVLCIWWCHQEVQRGSLSQRRDSVGDAIYEARAHNLHKITVVLTECKLNV